MKYKIGDKVRIRQWKAMEREFGVDKNGDIPISGRVFLKGMKEYCGRVGMIVRVVDDEKVCGFFPFYKIDIDDGKFRWADDMFEGYAFEYGEVAEVSNNNKDWKKGIYLGYIDGAIYPYRIVVPFDEKNFYEGEQVTLRGYKYARPLSKKHIIIIDGKEIEISEESYNNLKKSLEDR